MNGLEGVLSQLNGLGFTLQTEHAWLRHGAQPDPDKCSR
jgi:hypothetical protein